MPDDAHNGTEGHATVRKAASTTAIVAAVFCVVVSVVLVSQHLSYDAQKMLDSKELDTLKVDLTKKPTDETLKDRIRAVDLSHRIGFQKRQEASAAGRYLLLAGVVVLVLSVRMLSKLAEKSPVPGRPGNNDVDDSVATWSRAGTAIVAVLFVGLAAVFAGTYSSSLDAPLPKTAPAAVADQTAGADGKPVTPVAPLAPVAPATPAFPSLEEVRANWPRLFGPCGDLVAVHTNSPTKWDGESGESILWKTELPLPGASSPIVWGDSIFLTVADKTTRTVLCFDAATGAQRWAKPVGPIPGGNILLKEDLWEDYSYAANTMATDGRRVYAMFANADIACFDFEGERKWALTLGALENSYGHATSLCMYRNLLIVQIDQKKPEKGEPLSRIDALDGATGKVVWSTKRPVIDSWPTPMVAFVDDEPQLLTAGNPFAISYDPATGKELWRVKCLTGDVAPSPSYSNGRAFFAMEGAMLTAVKVDGTGDVTKSHVLWTAEDDLPSIPTSMSDGERLYVLNSTGIMTCYDAAKGDKLWDVDLELSFMASPVLVGKNVYVVSDEGETVIFEASSEYKEIARNQLGEYVYATPAFMDGRIYMRSASHLFCIGGTAE